MWWDPGLVDIILYTKSLQIWFLIRTHTRGNIDISLSVSLSLKLLNTFMGEDLKNNGEDDGDEEEREEEGQNSNLFVYIQRDVIFYMQVFNL